MNEQLKCGPCRKCVTKAQDMMLNDKYRMMIYPTSAGNTEAAPRSQQPSKPNTCKPAKTTSQEEYRIPESMTFQNTDRPDRACVSTRVQPARRTINSQIGPKSCDQPEYKKEVAANSKSRTPGTNKTPNTTQISLQTLQDGTFDTAEQPLPAKLSKLMSTPGTSKPADLKPKRQNQKSQPVQEITRTTNPECIITVDVTKQDQPLSYHMDRFANRMVTQVRAITKTSTSLPAKTTSDDAYQNTCTTINYDQTSTNAHETARTPTIEPGASQPAKTTSRDQLGWQWTGGVSKINLKSAQEADEDIGFIYQALKTKAKPN